MQEPCDACWQWREAYEEEGDPMMFGVLVYPHQMERAKDGYGIHTHTCGFGRLEVWFPGDGSRGECGWDCLWIEEEGGEAG